MTMLRGASPPLSRLESKNMQKRIVISGVPVGVIDVLRASELSATVKLIEGGVLNGVCANDGCVPIDFRSVTAEWK
ncbi:MAG: hypothetical protein KJZ95_22245 [Caldilinea sp.]|nr:hypothetical protein [Caldilinea sp.]